MRPPLWLHVEGVGAEVAVSLAICRNCGKPKATSDPCGLDHLAAVVEFKQWLDEHGSWRIDRNTPPSTPTHDTTSEREESDRG